MKHGEQDVSTIDKIIDDYGGNRDALIQMLLGAQAEYRWLSNPVLTRLSKRLAIPLSYIYNVTTFYKHFSLLPKGRHSVSVCLGTACHVRGAARLLDRVTDSLGIGPGQTTPDEKFTLNTVNCLGCCGQSPVVRVDDEIYGYVKASEVPKIVANYQ